MVLLALPLTECSVMMENLNVQQLFNDVTSFYDARQECHLKYCVQENPIKSEIAVVEQFKIIDNELLPMIAVFIAKFLRCNAKKLEIIDKFFENNSRAKDKLLIALENPTMAITLFLFPESTSKINKLLGLEIYIDDVINENIKCLQSMYKLESPDFIPVSTILKDLIPCISTAFVKGLYKLRENKHEELFEFYSNMLAVLKETPAYKRSEISNSAIWQLDLLINSKDPITNFEITEDHAAESKVFLGIFKSVFDLENSSERIGIIRYLLHRYNMLGEHVSEDSASIMRCGKHG